MSEDSSKPLSTPAKSPGLQGWRAALMVLFATVFLFYASQVVSAIAVNLYPVLLHWSHDQTKTWLETSVPAQFVFGLVADGLLIGGVALTIKWLHWNWQAIGLKKPHLMHIFLGVTAFIPYYFCYALIAVLLSTYIPSLNLDQHQEIGFNSVHGVIPMVLTFISLAVLPPLAEEITMRGFLYTGLKKWLPKIIAALVVSALFGLAHLAEGGDAGPLWVGALDTFILSLFLVSLRELTGNLWASIALHATKNTVAFVVLFIIWGR